MKAASSALIALLAGDKFLMADMLTVSLVNGGTGHYTDWDTDLVVGGNTYLAGDLKFSRDKTRTIAGVEVDTMKLTLLADSSNVIGGTPVLQLITSGAMDGARVKVDRLFMATAGDTSAGTASVFSGRVADSQIGRTGAVLSVASDLVLLNVQMPRNVYQPMCLHTLFDDDMLALGNSPLGCQLVKASFAVSLTANSGATKTLVPTSASQTDTYFDLGYLVFTSGANNGQRRSIKQYVGGSFTLSYPLPSNPILGDSFTAYPGCNHTLNACATKFSNQANFRGFPFVPSPEIAI